MLFGGTRWKNLLIIKHFSIKLTSKPYRKIVTPLFHLNLYASFPPISISLHNRQVALILSTALSQPARDSVLINSLRMPIFETIEDLRGRIRPKSIVRLSLLPSSQIASSSEIRDQLKIVLSYQSEQKKGTLDFNQKKILNSGSNLMELLFPFNVTVWMNALRTWPVLRHFSSLLFESRGVIAAEYSKPHWIISHNYKLYTSRDPPLLVTDLLNLLEVLKKFDFFSFLNNFRICGNRRPKYQAICKKLIRQFEWSGNETQEYLIYLVVNFGAEHFIEILRDFEKVVFHFQRGITREEEQLQLLSEKEIFMF